MREELKQRIAAFLCDVFESGKVAGDMGLSDADAMAAEREPAWLDAFAQEHKEIFEDQDLETEHDWPVWEAKAEEVLKLLTNG